MMLPLLQSFKWRQHKSLFCTEAHVSDTLVVKYVAKGIPSLLTDYKPTVHKIHVRKCQ